MADEEMLMPASAAQASVSRVLTVDEYVAYRRDGFLVLRGLIPERDIAELRRHTEDYIAGTLPEQASGLLPTPTGASPAERARSVSWRPMLHRLLPLHERWLLHPLVLDVAQALIGPDVLAMQTMLFLKPPGDVPNGWHQDSWHLGTQPDSLCGAWIPLDHCDDENGALWGAVGSHVEPVHSSPGQPHPDRRLAGMADMAHLHSGDDALNELSPVAARYEQRLLVMAPGDVVFLHGHLLHRSHANRSATRFRRAFVSHYCNARSFTRWGSTFPPGHDQHALADERAGGATNGSFILARGGTTLPSSPPRFA
jgi:hypothetical protein